LESLKSGAKVCRKGWNGNNMWICLTKGSVIPCELARGGAALAIAKEDKRKQITINDHIDMKTSDGSVCCGWLASQADMLADDWMIVS